MVYLDNNWYFYNLLLVAAILFSLSSSSAAQQGARGVYEVKTGDTSTESTFYYDGSHALLIGNSQYIDWPDLTTIPTEMRSLVPVLTNQGFKIFGGRVHLNLTETEIESLVEQFLESPGTRSPNARVLFYYAGHGYTLDGSGFLVTRDAPDPKHDRDGFENSAVWISDFNQWARKARAKHVLFCFDSCFAGTVFQSRGRTAPEEISLLTQSPVREFLTAGGADEPVPARGFFTEFFKIGIEGLADMDADGYVTGTELFSYLRGKVAEATFSTTRNEVQFGKLPDPRYQKGDFVFGYKKPDGGISIPKATIAKPAVSKPETVPLLGTLVIKSPQSATVTLNSSEEFRVVEGRALEWKEIEAGSYDIKVDNVAGETFRKVILVRDGARTVVDVVFPQKAGDVRRDNILGMPFVYCPAGSFAMGSPATEVGRYNSEQPQVQVILTKGFWIGQYEVRQKDWKRFVQSKRYRPESGRVGDKRGPLSRFAWGGDYPIVKITWNDAVALCNWLTDTERKAGRLPADEVYHLPSYAQWEYACRAGTTGMSYLGDFEILGARNAPKLGKMAWYAGNSGVPFRDGVTSSSWKEKELDHQRAGIHPVGQKLPNPWGVYDMLGNAWEWVGGWHAVKLSGGADPQGPSSGKKRSIRGGGWGNDARLCRSAVRDGRLPIENNFSIGFRMARGPAF